MKFAWCTDVHLNFPDPNKANKFYESLSKYDAVILSGDIAEALNFDRYLESMWNKIQKPIYYVLGNHDYYEGEIDLVREKAYNLFTRNNDIVYLTMVQKECLVGVKDDYAIVGVDGFADTRAGDYANSRIMLNDEVYIENFRLANSAGRALLQEERMHWSDSDTANLKDQIECVIDRLNPVEVVVVTHVPPFEEACRYRGRTTGLDYLPFYCNKGLGDYLVKVATDNPNRMVRVLCGHTHGKCDFERLENLKVHVGGVRYYDPEIQLVLEMGE